MPNSNIQSCGGLWVTEQWYTSDCRPVNSNIHVESVSGHVGSTAVVYSLVMGMLVAEQ